MRNCFVLYHTDDNNQIICLIKWLVLDPDFSQCESDLDDPESDLHDLESDPENPENTQENIENTQNIENT